MNVKNNQIEEMMEILSVVKSCPYLKKINCFNNLSKASLKLFNKL